MNLSIAAILCSILATASAGAVSIIGSILQVLALTVGRIVSGPLEMAIVQTVAKTFCDALMWVEQRMEDERVFLTDDVL